jgi:GH25 family lysozyme M1 (1,4-beta-N-acetylmuramidase)
MGIYGVDLSNNNGSVIPVELQAEFVFHKATEGTTFVDKDYQLRGSAIMARKVPFGAYHYARVHEDARAQVGHFLSVARLQPPMLVPFVDIEGAGNEGATGAQWRSWLATWFSEMKGVHNRRCGLYVSPGFADTYGFGQSSWLAENYLFVAHWGVQSPRIPKPWHKAAIWQFTATGKVPGVSGDCDRDQWLASFDSLTVVR